MRQVDITQAQMIELLNPLFEYVGVNAQDVSAVKVTAGAVDIEHRMYGRNSTAHFPYKEA